ncbi:phage portal protein [Corynebacterium incognita]|uniref:Phage portal protein n=2 Tax=Corynebacterium incognita TaxID=2754725 RepID=A0A7G7CRP8_9CORY|nr:phage portal protein [Corynebacterium incognita]
MNLPAPGSTWPPTQWEPVTRMINDAAVWWEGDAKHLDSRYTGVTNRPSQYMGGVVGAASRFFWGSPVPQGQTNRKVHLPIAADIAATAATLLFETPPTFSCEDEHQAGRLDALFNNDMFPADLLVMGESLSALGGAFGRVMWDTEIADEPWIEFVDADSAFPEFSYGRLVAVTFHEELAALDDKHTWRLLSRYTAGRIEYGLYEGTVDNVGKPKPLTDHPATQALANIVDSNSGVESHTSGIAAVYIPNVRPVVEFRKYGQLRHIGRPDLSPDLYGLFDLLDETWSDIRREMKLGKARATVPESWLKTNGLGQGKTFDVDREFYDGMNIPPTDGSAQAHLFQPSLRFDKYLQLADATVLEILRRANYSPATFGITNQGAQKTAREIDSEYKASLQTWKAKSRYVRAGLSQLAVAALEVDAWLNGHPAPADKVTITMEPPVQETMLDKAQTIQALDAARAISTERKVASLYPDMSQADQDTEVQRIKAEQAGVLDPLGNLDPDEPFEMD